MLNYTTHLIAKIDPLKYFLSKASLTSHVAKWVLILSEFKIFYKDLKAIKGKFIVNQLVYSPLQGDLHHKKIPIVLSTNQSKNFIHHTT